MPAQLPNWCSCAMPQSGLWRPETTRDPWVYSRARANYKQRPTKTSQEAQQGVVCLGSPRSPIVSKAHPHVVFVPVRSPARSHVSSTIPTHCERAKLGNRAVALLNDPSPLPSTPFLSYPSFPLLFRSPSLPSPSFLLLPFSSPFRILPFRILPFSSRHPYFSTISATTLT